MSRSELPKNVLSSPSQSERDTLRSTMRFHELVYGSAAEAMKEAHQNRMKNLRKELDYLKETEWKYEPIEKYIGQS